MYIWWLTIHCMDFHYIWYISIGQFNNHFTWYSAFISVCTSIYTCSVHMHSMLSHSALLLVLCYGKTQDTCSTIFVEKQPMLTFPNTIIPESKSNHQTHLSAWSKIPFPRLYRLCCKPMSTKRVKLLQPAVYFWMCPHIMIGLTRRCHFILSKIWKAITVRVWIERGPFGWRNSC